MKKAIFLLSFLFLFSFPVNAQEWDAFDKILFSTLISSHALDSFQTKYIFDHPEKYREWNPIIRKGVNQLGNSFIPLYFASCISLEFLVANDMQSSLMRKTTLFLFNINAFSFVKHNHDIGIGLTLWFK